MSGNFNLHGQNPYEQAQDEQYPSYDEFQQSYQPPPQFFPYGLPHAASQAANAPPAVLPLEFNPLLQNAFVGPAPFPDNHIPTNADVARWIEEEAETSPVDIKGGGKLRRKAVGGEHVKHRRTRSGCYTCRQRRVKCDENRPVCERCRKGQRECVYPDVSSSSKSGSKGGARRKPSMESLSEEAEDEEELESPTATRADPGESSKPLKSPTGSELPRAVTRQHDRAALNLTRAGASSLEQAKEASLSPSTEGSHHLPSALNSGRVSTVSTKTSHEEIPSSPFPKDQQFFLDYHRQNLTYHHYQFKYDNYDFVHSTLLDYALHYDPLLYAVIGFAAFHHTVDNPKGKVSDFLGYYNRSVSLLRKSLGSNKQHTVSMLLTILQLATFEEYLGDWLNLFGHQRAAGEMLLELYEPTTIMQDENSRIILSWYARFDLFVGMMAGNEPTLGPEWFRYNAQWYNQAVKENPEDLKTQIENYFATHRLFAVEMALLNAKLPKGAIPIEDYLREIASLRVRISDARQIIESLRQRTEYQVQSLDDASPADIVEPYMPGRLMKGLLFPVNIMLMDCSAIEALALYQTSIVLQQPPPFGDLIRLAMEQIRVFEDIDSWAGSPRGAIVPLQASLGMICLFVPREERYTMWCRRKMAKIECHGYVFPESLRTKIAENWQEPSINDWWLPDEDTYPPVIRAIRSFIKERTIKPSSQLGIDIRAMKAMFSRFSIDDSTSNSPDSTANTADNSGASSAGGFHKLGSPSSDSAREGLSSPKDPQPISYPQQTQGSDIDVAISDAAAGWSTQGSQNPYSGYR